MKHIKQTVITVVVFGVIASSSLARERYLLLDDRIVEKAENAKLTVGTVEKHKANPLFTEDKPWEKRYDNLYGNVIFDKEEEKVVLNKHEYDSLLERIQELEKK